MIIFHEHAGVGLPGGGPFLVPMHERRENQGIGVENQSSQPVMIWALRGCQQFPAGQFPVAVIRKEFVTAVKRRLVSNLSTRRRLVRMRCINDGGASLIEIGYRNGGTNTFKPKI
jgi:hypothetical protein